MAKKLTKWSVAYSIWIQLSLRDPAQQESVRFRVTSLAVLKLACRYKLAIGVLPYSLCLACRYKLAIGVLPYSCRYKLAIGVLPYSCRYKLAIGVLPNLPCLALSGLSSQPALCEGRGE